VKEARKTPVVDSETTRYTDTVIIGSHMTTECELQPHIWHIVQGETELKWEVYKVVAPKQKGQKNS
jgi:hypothetical protein